MTVHKKIEAKKSLVCSDVIVRTATDHWVIPHSCKILKTLLHERDIQASDLQFNSDLQCHNFIKCLLLLATEDECLNQAPSQLGELARDLIRSFNR